MNETENTNKLEEEVREAILAVLPESPSTEKPATEAQAAAAPKTEKAAPKKKGTGKKVETRTERMQDSRAREQERQLTQHERDERNMTWQLLQSAQRTGGIMNGKINSIKESSEGSVFVTVDINGIEVIIPANEMGITNLLDSEAVDEKDRIRREKQLLSKNLGAEISFVIVSTNLVDDLDNPGQKKPMVFASRKKALLRKIKENYIPKGDGTAKIRAGETVKDCQIISVGTHGIRVEVGGIDTSIPKYLLSYKFLTDLNREFRVGQKIDVYVQEVKKAEKGILTVTASHKHALTGFYRKNLKKVSVEGVYMGTITTINGDNAVIYLDDKDVVAMSKLLKVYGTNQLPAAGDTVVFIVKRILEEKGIALGMVTKVIKNS